MRIILDHASRFQNVRNAGAYMYRRRACAVISFFTMSAPTTAAASCRPLARHAARPIRVVKLLPSWEKPCRSASGRPAGAVQLLMVSPVRIRDDEVGADDHVDTSRASYAHTSPASPCYQHIQNARCACRTRVALISSYHQVSTGTSRRAARLWRRSPHAAHREYLDHAVHARLPRMHCMCNRLPRVPAHGNRQVRRRRFPDFRRVQVQRL